jgi:hypothetical protein
MRLAGGLTQAAELCTSASMLWRENERDVPEQIVNAYRHHYSKVLDFVQLQGRLGHSYERLRTQAEAAFHALLLVSSNVATAVAPTYHISGLASCRNQPQRRWQRVLC